MTRARRGCAAISIFALFDFRMPHVTADFVLRWYSPRVITIPLYGVVLFLLPAAFAGAFVDWRYVRNGGRRAGKREWRMLLVAVLTEIALLVALGYCGATARSMGQLIVWLAFLTLELWEFERWRIRRSYPRELPRVV